MGGWLERSWKDRERRCIMRRLMHCVKSNRQQEAAKGRRSPAAVTGGRSRCRVHNKSKWTYGTRVESGMGQRL